MIAIPFGQFLIGFALKEAELAGRIPNVKLNSFLVIVSNFGTHYAFPVEAEAAT